MGQADWLPRSKTAMLAMARNWLAKFNVKKHDWDIPDDVVANLAAKINALETLLAIPAADRTPTINAKIKTAEKALADTMRDIKKRYLFAPPLADADLVSLELKPRDPHNTPIPAPMVRPAATVKLLGAGAFDIHIAPERDISKNDKRSCHGCEIVYELFEHGAPAPTSETQLKKNKFVRKQKVSFVFQPQDSSKTAYFAMRYENSKGDAGPWCPIFPVLIP